MFDCDKCASETSRMWLRLARLLNKQAVLRAARGMDRDAMRSAHCAEIAYWQATGEGTQVALKDLTTPTPQQEGR